MVDIICPLAGIGLTELPNSGRGYSSVVSPTYLFRYTDPIPIRGRQIKYTHQIGLVSPKKILCLRPCIHVVYMVQSLCFRFDKQQFSWQGDSGS